MRKKTFGITLVILLAMILTACGTANGSGTAASNQGTSTRSAAITPSTKLAIGTFKLEGTPQAVSATEAAKLIPLWQLMSQLETSSSTAPQEVTATANAIQAAMTHSQLQAIQGMQISERDVFTILQQSGALPSGGFGGGGAGQGGSGFTRPGNGGNFRGGGGGGLGFLFGGGNRPQQSNNNGNTANGGTGASGSGIGGFNSTLILQLVKLLQSKVQPG